MAKEKIRKLLREVEAKDKQINNLAGMLALLTNRFNGEVSFNQAELSSIPDASFSITLTDDVYTLKLTYEGTPLLTPITPENIIPENTAPES